MLFLSFNCRGLSILSKNIVLHRLVEEKHPNVLFLHKSMCDGQVIVAELELLIKGWKFVCVDVKDKYGGLLLGLKVICFHFLNSWVVVSGLGVSIYSIELKFPFWFINIYDPYLEREGLLNNILSKYCIDKSNIILGGDLNFSLGFSKIWGSQDRVDNNFDFFTPN